MNTPVPVALLRGHSHPVTSLRFHKASLVSGDENGWVFWWSLVTRRPLAVWKAHHEAILSLVWMDETHLLTQGRDDKLYVWRLELDDQGKSGLSVKPPNSLVSGDDSDAHPQPWKTYSLTVNSLNFCQVAWNSGLLAKPDLDSSDKVELLEWTDGAFRVVWNDIYPHINGVKTGIVMDLHIKDKKLIVGYEGGAVAVFDISDRNRYTPVLNYYVVSHVQPVLSVRAHPIKNEFVSSSADSLIVKHPIYDQVIPEEEPEEPEPERDPNGPPSPKIVEVQDSPELEPAQNVVRGFDVPEMELEEEIETEKPESKPLDAVNVRHSGLSSLQLDSEGDLIMTAGWDGKVRLFTYDDIARVSVFHERQGVGCVAFSTPTTEDKSNPRLAKTLATRWIAVGGKDGKIELYTIEQDTRLLEGQSKYLQ
ncbi:ASTRA-associated protein 1 [Yarrowia sp. C11]|nr:ASTRA-associated protein 1 [Yarrowia sp. C11]KAG5363977.1 ASTRA-associated protein 1 [Yarrowia sp. E02]